VLISLEQDLVNRPSTGTQCTGHGPGRLKKNSAASQHLLVIITEKVAFPEQNIDEQPVLLRHERLCAAARPRPDLAWKLIPVPGCDEL
jgi:hypothetical protein